MKYFIFNKNMDYTRGVSANLRLWEGTAGVECGDSRQPGVFLSRMLDSREKGTWWHRLVVESEVGENMAVILYLYAADSPARAEQIKARIQELEGDPPRLLDALEPFLELTCRNPGDLLLHQIRGRYLWLGLKLWGNGQAGPVIRRIQVYFPRESWTAFLPEIYQGEDSEFLDRYLCIFQTIYQEMEQKIRRSSAYLEIGQAEPEVLNWLASWLGMEDCRLWPPERLKAYLARGAAAWAVRGTPGGLVQMVELFTGYPAYLQEGGQDWEPRVFCLYIHEAAVAGAREYQALLRVIREGKPADMEVRVIALKPWFFLDSHTYLGINSRLRRYGQAALDGGDSMQYAVLGGNDR